MSTFLGFYNSYAFILVGVNPVKTPYTPMDTVEISNYRLRYVPIDFVVSKWIMFDFVSSVISLCTMCIIIAHVYICMYMYIRDALTTSSFVYL